MEEWKKQLANLIRTPDELKKILDLSDNECNEIKKVVDVYRMSITPYYASLIDPKDNECPIRKMIIPNIHELDDTMSSPNLEKEKEYETILGLREEYNGKATVLLTYMCPNYCRHCFRKYWVGKSNRTLSKDQIDDILNAIRNKTAIKEVCISGGEPLMVDDATIEHILCGLTKINHVKIVRVFSRIPIILPQRITEKLVEVLKKYPILYFCTHFNHKKELTSIAIESCKKLINAGIPVLNQTVLLKGINDNTETMKELLWELILNKIKPFYLYHCVKTTGTAHLVTPVEIGTEIIKKLYGEMSALAIPLYTVPLYGSKVLAMPNYEIH